MADFHLLSVLHGFTVPIVLGPCSHTPWDVPLPRLQRLNTKAHLDLPAVPEIAHVRCQWLRL